MSRIRLRPLGQACSLNTSKRTTIVSRDALRTCQQPGNLAIGFHSESGACVRRIYRPTLSQRGQLFQHNRHFTSKKGEAEPLPPVPSDVAEQYSLVDSLFGELSQDPATSQKIPEEKEIIKVLQTYQAIADRYTTSNERSVPGQEPKGASSSATSAMLKAMNKDQQESRVTPSDVLNNISTKATQLMGLPSIFISDEVLKSYIKLQSQLNRPQNFPTIFELYRTKPSPRPLNRAPYITFAEPSPNAPSVAVHPDVAEIALSAAIKHSLPLCLSVIDATYSQTSYARYKIIKSAIVPIAGAVAAPVAAYTLASQFALVQTTMDTTHATTVAMAGIMTYISVVGSMGYIAVTTSNDQMVRVTWASGMPLWERWVREEERAAVDKVAQAWGFRNRTRWGDEEGREWDELREYAGVKGMVLDKVEFMQGME
ncbi:hypothetical protein C1H76_3778 [Elsinoe australis]|uniref:Uncharacterized protein n=1 Tax=Elsinoe australis TaxID=40998 RepID=A0A4U7B3X0_9PEZI|nr:hypothetical protein C1H76_3778 [Elsinoe australis]